MKSEIIINNLSDHLPCMVSFDHFDHSTVQRELKLKRIINKIKLPWSLRPFPVVYRSFHYTFNLGLMRGAKLVTGKVGSRLIVVKAILPVIAKYSFPINNKFCCITNC